MGKSYKASDDDYEYEAKNRFRDRRSAKKQKASSQEASFKKDKDDED